MNYLIHMFQFKVNEKSQSKMYMKADYKEMEKESKN